MIEVQAQPLEQLRRRTSEKWSSYPPEILPLFVGEVDYPLAPVIADTLLERIRLSDTGYLGGQHEVAEAFASFAARRWDWHADPALVRVAADASAALVELLRLVIAPGDEVVVVTPAYPPFFALVAEAGGVVREVPSRAEDGWRLDPEAIGDAFAGGARALLLCNPHDPVGVVPTADELARLAELALAHGAVVISDEVHGPLTHATARFTPFLSVSDAARACGLAVASAGKAFNLSGVKCALMLGEGAFGRAVLDRVTEEVYYRTSILGVHATTAAFSRADDWLDGTIAAIQASSSLLGTLLEERLPDVLWHPPRSGFLAWLDFRPRGWGDEPSARALASGVALNAGSAFGAVGLGYARLNFACGPEVLRAAVDRLASSGKDHR